MRNNSLAKATPTAIVINITDVMFRPINFISETRKLIILVILIFIECYAVDIIMNKSSKKHILTYNTVR